MQWGLWTFDHLLTDDLTLCGVAAAAWHGLVDV